MTEHIESIENIKDPPTPLFPEPIEIDREHPDPVSVYPVSMFRDPIFPFDTSLVIILMMLLTPIVPEFSVFIIVVPELITVPIPGAIDISILALVTAVVPPVGYSFPPLAPPLTLETSTFPDEALLFTDSTNVSLPIFNPENLPDEVVPLSVHEDDEPEVTEATPPVFDPDNRPDITAALLTLVA